ncbi:MAG TPA: hypothetical protein DD381_14335 [Lentisphaeria bacterium]|nr:MAG: hypothetical protein A2X47_00935 [Lentisphaerae bacterium GWF2_38_69]HBM17503.1 hypothetical protein [Lentisphaeria bacterium]
MKITVKTSKGILIALITMATMAMTLQAQAYEDISQTLRVFNTLSYGLTFTYQGATNAKFKPQLGQKNTFTITPGSYADINYILQWTGNLSSDDGATVTFNITDCENGTELATCVIGSLYTSSTSYPNSKLALQNSPDNQAAPLAFYSYSTNVPPQTPVAPQNITTSWTNTPTVMALNPLKILQGTSTHVWNKGGEIITCDYMSWTESSSENLIYECAITSCDTEGLESSSPCDNGTNILTAKGPTNKNRPR